jgi:SAM-dependent methyltransferase
MPDEITLPEQLEKMRRDWDQRARENARHYVANSRADWSDEEFFASGEQAIREQILNDPINIYQGRDPARMRVIEIGCGAGRLTLALSNLFGEVHAVDVSGEMIAQAREKLAHRANVHLYQNNGCDLAVLPRGPFDFAFSVLVFQHIPSYRVIERYVREVHRLLRPGALFKFQVQGCAEMDLSPGDTWHGVPFSTEQANEMAERCGFEMRYTHREDDQYFWLWYFKRPWLEGAKHKFRYQIRRVRRGLRRRLRRWLGAS